MRPPYTPHKRSSSVRSKRAKRKPAKKTRAKKPTPSGVPKRRAKKPPKKPRAKKPAKSRASKKRSAAASKGWETRRKKKRLLEAMADLRMKRIEAENGGQPLGWLERRADVRRVDDDGTFWREIFTTYDQDLVDDKRLETLAELEIDMLNRFELHDYLEWLGSETDVDTSDMYRMYLGYPLAGDSA